MYSGQARGLNVLRASATPVLACQLVVVFVLVGLIWFVQLVHYPLLAEVGTEAFVRYETLHRQRITPLVAPLMFVEAGGACLLLLVVRQTASSRLAWTALFLLLSIWGSTFFWQVPLHERLNEGFNAATHLELVRSNWLRTLAWTARGGLLLAIAQREWFSARSLSMPQR